MKRIIAPLLPAATFLLPGKIFSAEIMGYPVSPVQAKFYLLILGLLAVSAGMVAVAYSVFWVLDWKKKKPISAQIPSVKEKGFAAGLAVAAPRAR